MVAKHAVAVSCDCLIERPWREGLPPRSRLLAQKPLGVGTAQGEGLTSYVARLALHHRISVRDLGREIVIPLIPGESSSDGCAPWRLRLLSGVGSVASEWAAALSQLTCVEQLDALTLTRWRAVLPVRELMAKEDKWCPQCLNEDRMNGGDVYGRLLWELAPATACPTHGVRLVSACPHCGSVWRRGDKVVVPVPGYCHRCGTWQGDGEAPPADEDELHRARQLGAVVALTGTMKEMPTAAGVAAVMREAIATEFDGNLAAFGRAVGRPKNTVCVWVGAGSLPGLPALLDASMVLGVPLVDILTGNTTRRRIPVAEISSILRMSERAKPRAIDWDAVESELERYAELDPPLSGSQVAERLGIANRLLYARQPERMKRIGARYLAFEAEDSRLRLEERLAAADTAAKTLTESGIAPTFKAMKAMLEKDFCFAGSRLWTVWRERQLVRLGESGD